MELQKNGGPVIPALQLRVALCTLAVEIIIYMHWIPTTGTKIWSFSDGNSVSWSPAVVNGIVYVGSSDGNVYALNTNPGSPPFSAFNGTPVYGKAFLTVSFTDNSKNATSWNWTFGDGSLMNATKQSPVIPTQSLEHLLPVSLNVTNAYGSDYTTKTAYITVSASSSGSKPVAEFHRLPAFWYRPFIVRFTDTSNYTPNVWSWNFGDGSTTNATKKNPVHTYEHTRYLLRFTGCYESLWG